MNRVLAGLAVLAASAAAMSAAAQSQDDDWEFQEDAARGITVAAARYNGGQMILVQCRQGRLTAVLTGLPQSSESLQVQAVRTDGRSVSQGWQPAGAPGAYQAASPGRDVRFLRGGGRYSLRTSDGAATPVAVDFDLPSQSANLDRVLTTCGWATTDDRDLLPDATEISVADPNAEPFRVERRRGAPRASGRAPDGPPMPAAPPPAEREISCIVRAMHLRECRAMHPASAEQSEVRSAVSYFEGREVYPVPGKDAAASDGKLVHVSGSRVTVIDYIGTIPAR